MSADAQALADQLAQMQLAGAQGDGPTPPQLGPLLKGLGKGLWGQATNAYDMVRHPVDAATGVAHAVSHPIDTGKALGTQAWDTLTSGDPEQYGEMAGGMVGPGDIAKGLGLVSDAGKVSNIWGGAKAASHDAERAVDAQAMQALGSSDKEIWDTTAQYNTPKEWGQETPWHWIDDSKAQVLSGSVDKLKAMDRPMTLGSVMRHDWDAFKSYPGLKDLPVVYDRDLPSNVYGGYSPEHGVIALGDGALDHPDSEQLRRTLVHETQHAVQHFEGMPSGSSPYLAQKQARGIQMALDSDDLPLPDKAAARELSATFRHAVAPDRLTTDLDGPLSGWPMRAYSNTAGEVGARTAEAMLSAPRGTRPHELAAGLASVSPHDQLVVGARQALFHPALKHSESMPSWLTGEFEQPGPDLSRRR